MRKSLLIAGIAAVTLSVASTAIASSWTPPNNVRIVQQSYSTTTNVSSTIMGAVNSITNAAANNPYLVKVMPGTYSEKVTLKPYVYLEGSGPESTIITSAISNSGQNTCVTGTVIMANNSAIRNVKIVNTSTQGGNDTNALLFPDGVTATAEGVSVVSGKDNADSGYNRAICIGDSAHATLNNINAESHNDGDSRAVYFAPGTTCGTLTLKNSRIAAFSTSSAAGATTLDCSPSSGETITIKDSSLEATAGSGCASGVYAGAYITSIDDSTITTSSATCMYAFEAEQTFSMMNSKVIFNGAGTKTYYNNGSGTKISTSLLSGDSSALSSAKLVHCFDDSYNAISNQ